MAISQEHKTQLMALIHGELDPHEVQKIETLIKQDAEYRQEFESLRKSSADLRHYFNVIPSDGFSEKQLQQIRDKVKTPADTESPSSNSETKASEPDIVMTPGEPLETGRHTSRQRTYRFLALGSALAAAIAGVIIMSSENIFLKDAADEPHPVLTTSESTATPEAPSPAESPQPALPTTSQVASLSPETEGQISTAMPEPSNAPTIEPVESNEAEDSLSEGKKLDEYLVDPKPISKKITAKTAAQSPTRKKVKLQTPDIIATKLSQPGKQKKTSAEIMTAGKRLSKASNKGLPQARVAPAQDKNAPSTSTALIAAIQMMTVRGLDKKKMTSFLEKKLIGNSSCVKTKNPARIHAVMTFTAKGKVGSVTTSPRNPDLESCLKGKLADLPTSLGTISEKLSATFDLKIR